MNKFILYTALLLLSACSSGGDDSGGVTPPVTPITAPPGIYTGTVTPTGMPADSALAIITSDGKAAIIGIDNVDAFIGTILALDITGTMYPTAATAVPATAKVITVSGDDISGTYSSTIAGGTFAMTANTALYNRTSSLTKLVGIWTDIIFINNFGMTTWDIIADGSFTIASTVATCSGTGNFTVINPSNNEYNLTFTIINCPGLNGIYSGIAIVSDTAGFTDNTISLVYGNGVNGGIMEPIKQ